MIILFYRSKSGRMNEVAITGLIYGAWVDGTPLGLLALYLAMLIAVLGVALWLVSRNQQKMIAEESSVVTK